MKRTRLTRALAVLMALLISLSMAACAGGGSSESSKESVESSTEESSASESSGQETTEPRKVSCVGMNYTNASRPWWSIENYPNWESGKAFDQKLAELNIELEIETIPNEQYEETMKTRLASNLDLPDIIKGAGSKTDWLGYGQNGMIWNVTELLETYDADGSIMAFLEKVCPTSLPTILDENGDLWWLPYAYMEDCSAVVAFTMSLRADWMESLGIEFKNFYTPDELYDILLAFREKDANGNGVEDEVLAFNLAGEWEPISAGFGMGQNYIYALNDGKGVHCKLDHENFPAFIEYCQKLYNAGIWSTEILNSDNGIESGNRASAIYNYSQESWVEPSIAGYEDVAEYAGIIIDDDEGANGYTFAGVDNTDMASMGWLINKDCKDPQAVVDLLDYIYSDEGATDCYWGVEGVSYQYNEERGMNEFIGIQAEMYYEENANMSPLFMVVFCNVIPGVVYIDYGNSYDNLVIMQQREGYDKKNMILDDLWDAYKNGIPGCPTTQPYALPTDAEREVLNAKSTDVNTYINELILDLIIGNKSLDDLPTYRAELTDLGLDEMIAVYQARYDRYMASQK